MNATTTTETVKVKAVRIELERWEGRIHECVTEVCIGGKVFANANATLLRWRGSAPGEGGGYHKCGFKVTYEDGETYEGRYDLTRMEWPDLAKHMIRHCEGSAGRWKPPHATDEQWATYLREIIGPEKQAEYARFLDTYAIGDE